MDSNLSVKQWMQEFYQQKQFADDAEKARWIFIRLGFIKIPFPNLRQRREAIYLHDLNHLLTGYDTSWTGEGEIAAWELASGFPIKYWIGYVYPPTTFLLGLIIAPKRTIRAFRQGLGKHNIYKLKLQRNEIEQLKVAELKAILQQ